jgi:two-component system, cell cycle response regulator
VNAMSEQTDSKQGANASLDMALKPEKTPVKESNSKQQNSDESNPANKIRYSALVVDDNLSSQKLLALSLSMQPQIGLIDFAENGESAILKAQSKEYDLIFLDAKMPGIDGYETCARLREIPDYKNTPIIMVTGLTSPMDEAKGIIAGSTTYVTKPVQQVPFKKLINRQLALLEYRKSIQQPET